MTKIAPQNMEDKLARKQIALPGELTCQKCDLAPTRKNVVLAEGELTADIMFIGEAPGFEEDKHGHPMIGPTGNNLDVLLRLFHVDRSRVIITNIISCLPLRVYEKLHAKRIGKPKKKEKDACAYWLDQKILDSNVQLVIPVGDHALKKFLPNTSIGKVHGKTFPIHFVSEVEDLPEDCPREKDILVLPLYHPAASLHNPDMKHVLVEDYAKIPEALKHLPDPPPNEAVTLIEQWSEVMELGKEIKRNGVVSFDFETSGLDSLSDQIVGVAISADPEKTYYIPTFPCTDCAKENPKLKSCKHYFKIETVLKWMKPFFERDDIKVIAQNLKFEIGFTEAILGRVEWTNFFDTAVEYYLLERPSHALKDLALKELNILMTPISTFIGKRKSPHKNMLQASQEDLGAVALYAGMDALVTIRLHILAEIELRGKDMMWESYTDIDLPCIPILSRIDRRGVLIDQMKLDRLEPILRASQDRTENEAREMGGLDNLNMSSPEQVSGLLFDALNLTPPTGAPITEKGYYSTDQKKVLDKMDFHPVIALIKEYKKAEKFLGYVKRMRQPHKVSGRLHTHFNLTSTSTKRLSSSKPINFQNIPVRDPLGKLLRAAFYAQTGWIILKADFNQMELRLEAGLSGDPYKCEVYARNGDIHGEGSLRIYGDRDDYKEKASTYRKMTKNGVFGGLYRGGAKTIAQFMEVPVHEAEAFILSQRELSPRTDEWFYESVDIARRLGYSQTLYGHRRTLPNLTSGRDYYRAEAERFAYSMQIQGLAADVMKIALIRVQKAIDQRGLECRILIQVHDELVMELPPDEAEEMFHIIQEAYTDFPELAVPMRSTYEIGLNWLDTEEVCKDMVNPSDETILSEYKKLVQYHKQLIAGYQWLADLS